MVTELLVFACNPLQKLLVTILLKIVVFIKIPGL